MPSQKLLFDEEIEPKDFGAPSVVKGKFVWRSPHGMDKSLARILKATVSAVNKLIAEGTAKIDHNGNLKLRK